jgi:hypothetical protein
MPFQKSNRGALVVGLVSRCLGHPSWKAHTALLPNPDDDTLRPDWLSNACPDRQGGEVLEGVLFEARQPAGFSQRQLTRYWDTIQTDKRIFRLTANGHTNAGIAELMSALGRRY